MYPCNDYGVVADNIDLQIGRKYMGPEKKMIELLHWVGGFVFHLLKPEDCSLRPEDLLLLQPEGNLSKEPRNIEPTMEHLDATIEEVEESDQRLAFIIGEVISLYPEILSPSENVEVHARTGTKVETQKKTPKVSAQDAVHETPMPPTEIHTQQVQEGNPNSYSGMLGTLAPFMDQVRSAGHKRDEKSTGEYIGVADAGFVKTASVIGESTLYDRFDEGDWCDLDTGIDIGVTWFNGLFHLQWKCLLGLFWKLFWISHIFEFGRLSGEVKGEAFDEHYDKNFSSKHNFLKKCFHASLCHEIQVIFCFSIIFSFSFTFHRIWWIQGTSTSMTGMHL